MNKKILALAAAVVLTSPAVVCATGLGPQLNLSSNLTAGYPGNFWGLSCSAKFNSMPVYWSLSADTGDYTYKDSDNSSVKTSFLRTTLTGDYWVMNPTIKGIWKWYWGFGGTVSTTVSADWDLYLSVGPRAVIGMNWHFLDGFLELYTQGAFQPEIEFAFGSDGSANGIVRTPVYFPFNIGVRFWF
ncbi:MAG: hypothetical protein WCR31_06525 [Treponema sp.]